MQPLPLPFIAPVHLGTSAWLLRLRWFAVGGQLITLGVAGWLGGELLWAPLLGLIALTAISNAGYAWWLARIEPCSTEPRDAGPRDAVASSGRHASETPPGDQAALPDDCQPLGTLEPQGTRKAQAAQEEQADRIATSLMMLDMATLTAMLYFSGGIDNPFSVFYFVNLAVGGVILPPRWAWVLTAMATAGCGWLLYHALPLSGLEPPPEPGLTLHNAGLFVAYATCGSVVTQFVTRTAAELTRSERRLQQTQAEHQRALRLEGLTTLAAGAAHELATPLSTIDVIARELGRHLRDCETPESVRRDVQLIDEQLEICRQILRRMRVAVGDSMADSWDRTTVGDLIDCALEGVRHPDRVDVEDGPKAVEEQPLWIPQEAVAQAIRNLIHNGLDAGGPQGRVSLQATVDGSQVRLQIRDSGRGMSDEELGRAGEPFYTTKEPGRGMGLGLFLTRNVVSRLGGTLTFESTPGKGTEATVTLPCRR